MRYNTFWWGVTFVPETDEDKDLLKRLFESLPEWGADKYDEVGDATLDSDTGALTIDR